MKDAVSGNLRFPCAYLTTVGTGEDVAAKTGVGRLDFFAVYCGLSRLIDARGGLIDSFLEMLGRGDKRDLFGTKVM